MISTAFALFCLAGWVATGIVFIIAMSGSSNMRDKERRRTDRAEARVRELEAHRCDDSPVRIVPIADSEQVQRIAAVIAHNEAARMDPDVEDWSARERGRR